MNKTELIDIIKNIKNHFQKNILASNALNGKVEKELNVAIIREINNHLNPTFFALKGWRYIDAAVFAKKKIPHSLIEMKAHNSIDFPWWLISHYPGKDYPMLKDIKKLLQHAQPQTELYYIFFNNIMRSNGSSPTDPYKRLVSRTNHMTYKEKGNYSGHLFFSKTVLNKNRLFYS